MINLIRMFRGTTLLDERDRREIDDAIGNHARAITLLMQGRISASGDATTAPTAGTWRRGDFVRNSEPSELGSSPNKYVVLGWSCVTSGTPGTWVACRCLTGN